MEGDRFGDSDIPRRLAEAWPRAEIEPAVDARLESWAQDDRSVLWIAWSGGLDSTALAGWLAGTFSKAVDAGRLRALTIDHGVRGPAGAADAEWVRCQGARWSIPVVTRTLTGLPDDEAALRAARLGIYAEVAGDGPIALGHHADDVLEHLLFRTFRGSSLAALAGMRPIQILGEGTGPTLLRPLLRVPRLRLKETLESLGQPWREDATNADATHVRNRLRSKVVPALEKALPDRDLRRDAATLHGEMLELDAWIDAMAAHLVGPERGMTVTLESWRSFPAVIQRKALRHWLAPWMRDLSRSQLDALLAEDASEGIVQLSPEIRLRRTLRQLEILPSTGDVWEEWEPRELPISGNVVLPDGSTLSCEEVVLSPERRAAVLRGTVDATTEAYLRCSDPKGGLEVRNWRHGDRYFPLGAPGRRKLQDWFTDRRVPSERRHTLPLVTSENGEILWVPGFGPAQNLRLEPTTERALWLTYHPG